MKALNLFTVLMGIYLCMPFAQQACTISAEAPLELSNESRHAVGISMLKGAIGGVSTYMLGYWLAHDYTLPSIGEHPFAYGLWAVAGATLMGLWRSSYTPEAYFMYAKEGLMQLDREGIIERIADIEADDVSQKLKEIFFKDRFPIFAAFRYLEMRYEALERYQDALYIVLQSSRVDLRTQCYKMLEVIDACQTIIKNGIAQLKEEPKFIEECNAQTMVAMQHAAESQAVAAWANALSRPSVVVIKK